MTPEAFIQQKAAAAIQAIYNTEVAPGSLQVAVTRKEFEGDYTLVTFPLLKITRQAPDATGNAIGKWLVANVPEIAAFNSVKGFLNLSFSPVYWNEALQGIAADDAFGQLPSTVKYVTNAGGEMLKAILEGASLREGQLPVVFVADADDRVVFVSQGYTIGMGDKIVALSKKL
jgi:hypothetical protein